MKWKKWLGYAALIVFVEAFAFGLLLLMGMTKSARVNEESFDMTEILWVNTVIWLLANVALIGAVLIENWREKRNQN